MDVAINNITTTITVPQVDFNFSTMEPIAICFNKIALQVKCSENIS